MRVREILSCTARTLQFTRDYEPLPSGQDNCMRNVDRLQEQDPEQRRRSFASLLVLGTVLLGLFGAI
ncbi:MAG: hypothetical protein RL701_4851, partial [Pseudomonadota bacterium]